MAEPFLSAFAPLHERRTTSLELIDASFAAIERHASTHAFVSVDVEGARNAARSADRERASGIDRGPLHGVPISLKDIIDVAGTVSSAGSHVLDDRIAPADAAVVTRLRNAGAVILGKTNMHEFAFGTTSEDSAYGPVLHPADLSRLAGGSSGGSAVAVATGMGLASIGTDTGGSVRIPAAACGVVGLKPGRGEVPTEGVIPLSVTLDHVGPLARSVQDAAWIWQVMAGRATALVAPSDLKGLRLKRLIGYFDDPLDPVVRSAFAAAVAHLADGGASLTSGEIAGADHIAPTYVNLVLAEAAHWHAPYVDSRAARYQPQVHARISQGRTIPAVAYLEALDACTRFEREVNEALADCDALVLPTLPILAPLLGTTDIQVDSVDGALLPVRAVMLKHTQLFNMSRHPAISLPVASPSLPVGLQLVGRVGQTETLLAVAAACERRLAANATSVSA